MLETSLGRILVADHLGVYVIKMVGDVRLTLCVSFDQYIETLFGKNDFCTILFDLSEAEGLDSTTLGLIAKIAVKSESVKNIQPIVICSSTDIIKLLTSMGIDPSTKSAFERNLKARASSIKPRQTFSFLSQTPDFGIRDKYLG